MTWRPTTLAELRPMQTVRVNGRLAVRVHALHRASDGLVRITTDLGERIDLTDADRLLRLDRSSAMPAVPGRDEEGDEHAASVSSS